MNTLDKVMANLLFTWVYVATGIRNVMLSGTNASTASLIVGILFIIFGIVMPATLWIYDKYEES